MSTPDRRLDRSEPLHQQVAQNLRNAIEAGTLRGGEVLPSTRELAQQWDVSVFTISEAMKLLIGEGLIVSKSRSKRVVRKRDQAQPADLKLSTPQVILIGGYAGSGKTELGRILARQAKWPMLDKDTLTRPVVEAALETLGLSPHDRESATYLDTVRPREYEALIATAQENVECGNSAIVTAPFVREFNDEKWIERTRVALADRNANTTLLWVACDASTMHTYIRHRGAARDAAKLADWKDYLDGIDVEFRPAGSHVVVENSASSTPLQTQAAQILSDLAAAAQK